MDRLQMAEQFRKALQMLAMSFDEEKAMEVATIYAPWETGKKYEIGNFLIYGANGVDDPQLYKVVQAHTSQEDWTPDRTASLYKAIGLDEKGYPVWSQPTGAHDAYNQGDIVDYKGMLYTSLIDGNIYSPEEYSGVWADYAEEIL